MEQTSNNLASKKKELVQEPKTNTSKENSIADDFLELHDMPPKERRRYIRNQEKEKLKELSFWRKVQYILTYYTGKFLAVVAICAIVFFVIQRIYIATRPIALNINLVNDPNNSVFAEKVTELYESYYEVPEDARYLIDTNYLIRAMGPDEVPSNQELSYYTKMMSSLINDSTHIVICDAEVVDYYAIDGYFTELKYALPEDLFDAFENRLYQCDGPVEDSNYYAIDISGMEFTKQTNIQLEQPYICIPTILSEESRETSYRVLRMILDLEEQ